MAAEMGGAAPKSDPDAQIVAAVGDKLVRSTPAGSSPYAQNFNFYLLNDRKTINAFALPGGQIFITRALYDNSKMKPNSPAYSDTRSGTSSTDIPPSKWPRATSAAHLRPRQASAATMLVSLPVPRSRGRCFHSATGEKMSQSDSTGVEYMAKAGYDPRAMLGVMEILKKASGGGGKPEWLSSHPDRETGWKRSSRSSRTNSTIRRLYRRADR